jgi:hypothetical protein
MDEPIIQTKDEPKIEFRVISDKGLLAIKNPDINKNLVEISGYDLQVNFNMEYLNSIDDVEAAVNGISDLFRELIMEKLLEYKRKE